MTSSSKKALNVLNVNGKELTTLDLSLYPNLEKLFCSHNKLTHLDLFHCPKLKFLNISNNSLTKIDLSKNQNLETFICAFNEFTEIPILPPSLQVFIIANNPITHFELPANFSLLSKKVQNTINIIIENGDLNHFPSPSVAEVAPASLKEPRSLSKAKHSRESREIPIPLPTFSKIGNKIFDEEKMEAFDYYVSFTQVKNCDKVHCAEPVLNKVGKTSQNGFIYKIEYEAEMNNILYSSSAILKSNKQSSSDNLMYEYTVGCYINRHYSKRFPCFVQTYGVFRYKTPEILKTLGTTASNNFEILRTSMDLIDCAFCPNHKVSITKLIEEACTTPVFISLLVENIDNSISLYDFLSGIENGEYKNPDELKYILFQIYYVLSILSDDFTHYDLHGANILLYKPGGLIHFYYEIEDNKTIDFYSEFIVKFIDYGRCHVATESKRFFDQITKRPFIDKGEDNKDEDYESGDDCGRHSSMPFYDLVDYHIEPQFRNKSFDLLFLNYINKKSMHIIGNNNIAYRNEYDSNIIFGTKEILKSGYPTSINNVNDAYFWARDSVLKIQMVENVENVLGKLFIFKTKEMRFKPAQ